MRDSDAPERQGLSLRLAESFAGLLPALRTAISSSAASEPLPYPLVRLLFVLHRDGPMIMRELGDTLGLPPRRITALVDRLEDDGLLRRSPHASDRRAFVIELTSNGHDVASDTSAQYAARASKLFERLSVADQEEMLRLLDLLNAELKAG